MSGIVQDNKGFMWFSTYNGLNGYDGYNSKAYRHDSEDSGNLSGNPIRILCKDRAGEGWGKQLSILQPSHANQMFNRLKFRIISKDLTI